MILAALVLAATADIRVAAVVPAKTAVAYDETFRVTIRVHNAGPDAAPDVRVRAGGNAPGVIRAADAPPGWTCADLLRSAVTCRAPAMAAGAEAEFSILTTAPQPTPIAYRVGASATAAADDPNAVDNHVEVDVALLHPDRHSDLGLTMAVERNPVPEGAEVRATVDVRNRGPDTAREVTVAITENLGNRQTIIASGAGWSCAQVEQNALCTRPELPAGAAAPIAVRIAAPPREELLAVEARVRAEANRDSVNGNNTAVEFIGIGAAASWERILLPIATDFIGGAGGAAWRTELAALILADQVPEFRPHPCEFTSSPCPYTTPPLRRQIDAFSYLVHPHRDATGQYFYVRPGDARKFRLNARIYDAARFGDTAGAELPIVRDHDFRSDVITLLNVPTTTEYRHTLRIYDADGRRETLARVRIYAGNELEPRVNIVRVLRPASLQRTTTALLPTHPAFAQEELSHLLPLAGLAPLRVEIEPVDPAVRLWAFISITNNETHHVTLITP